jgi:hypothetical protein
MSNHSGSYMLNDVLHMLEKRSVFELLGKEQSYELILEIIKMRLTTIAINQKYSRKLGLD